MNPEASGRTRTNQRYATHPMRLSIADREFDKEHGEEEALVAAKYDHKLNETGMPRGDPN